MGGFGDKPTDGRGQPTMRPTNKRSRIALLATSSVTETDGGVAAIASVQSGDQHTHGDPEALVSGLRLPGDDSGAWLALEEERSPGSGSKVSLTTGIW